MVSCLLFPGLTIILYSIIFRPAVLVGFVVDEGGLPFVLSVVYSIYVGRFIMGVAVNREYFSNKVI
jgi:hypothetical protein